MCSGRPRYFYSATIPILGAASACSSPLVGFKAAHPVDLGREPISGISKWRRSDSGLYISRYDLTDFESRVIAPLLPNKPRGVPRVDDWRVLNGIFWVLRSGAPRRDLPERYGPRTTCYNRYTRWRKAGVWDSLMDAITAAYLAI